MQYIMLIYQGTAQARQAALPEEEQAAGPSPPTAPSEPAYAARPRKRSHHYGPTIASHV